MWFKNARLYRLTSPITVNLNEALAQFPFVPCGDHDHQRYGFVPPLQGSELLVHAGDHCGMICAKREEKILPGAAVKNAVEAKVLEIMNAESRPVARSERAAIKDEVIFSMLPKAFTRSKLEYAYIDLKLGLIIVDAASASKAEDLLSKLREALGSLRCIPVNTIKNVTGEITNWTQFKSPPQRFEIGQAVDMQDSKDGGVIRCRNFDLASDEVINHIKNGMLVTKLEMIWREAVTFTVDQSFGIKGLKFADAILDKANDGNPETKAEQFDNDFRVMSLELRNMITDLVEAFGGEDKSLIDNPVS
jgi:recombination associated protein RdgC